ncbi:MAG: hypothetical protein QOK23_4803 [Gammaproteobacteria bacterium]|jgi:hypothetical protein|nr:hypothetical protein [Gammaproteobacteria bacterium]
MAVAHEKVTAFELSRRSVPAALSAFDCTAADRVRTEIAVRFRWTRGPALQSGCLAQRVVVASVLRQSLLMP